MTLRRLSAIILPIILACTVTAAPRIVVAPDSFSMGTLIQGDIVSYSCEITNTGDADLVIGKIDRSCGCTAPEMAKKQLAPGEKGALKITFDSEKFFGNVHKTVTVYSNDPQKPYAVVAFTADIKRVWSYNPTYIKFSCEKDGKTTQEKEIAFTVTNDHQSPLTEINVVTDLKELVFSKRCPVTGLTLQANQTFDFSIEPKITAPVDSTRYGHVDLSVSFADGRKFTKRIGASIKKWQQ